MTKKTTDLSTLERIRLIVQADLSEIEAKSKQGALDRTSAGNLIDYAKLEMALERHDAELAEAKEADEIAKADYENLKKAAMAALASKKDEADGS